MLPLASKKSESCDPSLLKCLTCRKNTGIGDSLISRRFLEIRVLVEIGKMTVTVINKILGKTSAVNVVVYLWRRLEEASLS